MTIPPDPTKSLKATTNYCCLFLTCDKCRKFFNTKNKKYQKIKKLNIKMYLFQSFTFFFQFFEF